MIIRSSRSETPEMLCVRLGFDVGFVKTLRENPRINGQVELKLQLVAWKEFCDNEGEIELVLEKCPEYSS